MNKDRTKKYFSKSASTYDNHADLQKYIKDRLIEKLLTKDISKHETILDIGAGTASGARKLKETYPDAFATASDIAHGMMKHAKKNTQGGDSTIEFVTADMERLPFKDNSFDLVYSSSAAHWVNDLKRLFMRTDEIVKDNGVFCFSTFGKKTLRELKICFDMAYEKSSKDSREHLNRFTPLEEIIIDLNRSGFNDISVEVEKKKMYYHDLSDLLKKLKAIGSHTTDANTRYLGKDFIKLASEIYEQNFSEDQKVYATYVVYYLICRRKDLRGENG